MQGSKLVSFVIVVGAACFLASCATPERRSREMTQHLNSELDLSPEDMARITRQAKASDANAAFRLYLYYDFVRSDRSQAIHWLEIAAKKEHVTAQYNLGLLLQQSKHRRDWEAAAHWFDRAAQAGDRDAQRALAEAYEEGIGRPMDLRKA